MVSESYMVAVEPFYLRHISRQGSAGPHAQQFKIGPGSSGCEPSTRAPLDQGNKIRSWLSQVMSHGCQDILRVLGFLTQAAVAHVPEQVLPPDIQATCD